uniref:Peptidase M24 domain-containing protein n=1 Tax=Maylandia zebra TaxID=106582 RepID=A0A3P9BCK8_9CICH
SFCPFRPVYWLGNDTLRVFSGLKAKDSVMPKSVVVLQGGEKESFFHRAFGVTEAHCLGAIDVDSFLFVPKLPESYAAWIGKEKYAVDEVYFTLSLIRLSSIMVILGLLMTGRLQMEICGEYLFGGWGLFLLHEEFFHSTIFSEVTSEIYTRFCTQACKICSLFDMGGECYCFTFLTLFLFIDKNVYFEGVKVHLEELVKIGILHGSVKDMMKVHLGSVIMPHGLGHLLGIDVEDVGGYPEPGSRNLLMGHLVQEWMVLMVEAGTYLISHLSFINNQVLAHFFGFGGISMLLFVYVGPIW